MPTPSTALAIAIALSFPLAGCAAAGAEEPALHAGSASPTPLTGAWVSAPQETPAPAAPRRLAGGAGGSILIGAPAPPPAAARPRTHGRVHVSFHRADLE